MISLGGNGNCWRLGLDRSVNCRPRLSITLISSYSPGSAWPVLLASSRAAAGLLRLPPAPAALAFGPAGIPIVECLVFDA